MNQMVENMRSDSLSMSPDAVALKNWKFDQEVSREAMVNFNLSIITTKVQTMVSIRANNFNDIPAALFAQLKLNEMARGSIKIAT
jgi:hypothetical protein